MLLFLPLTSMAQAPTWQWVQAQRGIASDIVADNDGNSYALVSVYEQNELFGMPGSFSGEYVVKLDDSGLAAWAMQCQGCVIGKLVFARGSLYAAGEGWGEFNLGDMTVVGDTLSPTYFIAKFNPEGISDWSFIAQSSTNIQTGDISVNENDEVFVAGSGYGDVLVYGDTVLNEMGNAQAYFWKIGSDGTFHWLRSGGCVESAKTRARGAASDRIGNFYATGFTGADPALCDDTPFGPLSIPVTATFFLVKLSNDGVFEWVRWSQGLNPTDVETLNDSLLIVSGSAIGPTTFEGQDWINTDGVGQSALVAGFNMSGEPIWSTHSLGGNAYAYRLAMDSTRIWTAIDSDGPFQVGQILQPDSGYYTMILGMTRQGEPTWLAHINTELGEASCYIESTGFALGGNGVGYTTGYVLSENQIGCTLDWQSGSFDIPSEVDPYWTYFVARLNPVPVGISEGSIQRRLRAFPNPCDDAVRIDMDVPRGSFARIWTTDGRLVLEDRLSAEGGTVQTDALRNGYYLLEVQNAGERATMPILVQH